MKKINRKFRDITKVYFTKNSTKLEISENDSVSFFSSAIKKDLHLIHVADRKAAQRVSNIVFDGNVSSEGISSNEKIATIQAEAISILDKMKQEDAEITIDNSALNSVISSVVFDTEEENNYYYQAVKPKKDGSYITRKIGNLPFNLMLSPSRFLSILKDAFLIGKNAVDKNYVSVMFIFLELSKQLFELTEVELNKEQVKVIVYIQKYARSAISLDELEDAIAHSDFKFPIEYDDVEIKDLSKVLEQLSKLNIIKIDDGTGKIKIVEKVFFTN